MLYLLHCSVAGLSTVAGSSPERVTVTIIVATQEILAGCFILQHSQGLVDIAQQVICIIWCKITQSLDILLHVGRGQAAEEVQ